MDKKYCVKIGSKHIEKTKEELKIDLKNFYDSKGKYISDSELEKCTNLIIYLLDDDVSLENVINKKKSHS